MLLFVSAAVLGAFVLPRLFAGMFEVWPQKPDAFNMAEPLRPNSGNVTQTLYIVVNIAMLFTAALCASDGRTRPMLFVRAYLASGFVVAALCYWQFASSLTGIYYPEEFLHSNPRWTTLSSQALGAATRINGPFTEPAALATYLSGIIFACFWMLLRGSAGAGVRLLLLMSAVAMLLSTSTTGIVILAVFVPAALLRSATTRELRVIGLGVIGLLAGLLTLFFVASITMPAVVERIEAQADAIIEFDPQQERKRFGHGSNSQGSVRGRDAGPELWFRRRLGQRAQLQPHPRHSGQRRASRSGAHPLVRRARHPAGRPRAPSCPRR